MKKAKVFAKLLFIRALQAGFISAVAVGFVVGVNYLAALQNGTTDTIYINWNGAGESILVVMVMTMLMVVARRTRAFGVYSTSDVGITPPSLVAIMLGCTAGAIHYYFNNEGYSGPGVVNGIFFGILGANLLAGIIFHSKVVLPFAICVAGTSMFLEGNVIDFGILLGCILLLGTLGIVINIIVSGIFKKREFNDGEGEPVLL